MYENEPGKRVFKAYFLGVWRGIFRVMLGLENGVRNCVFFSTFLTVNWVSH